MKIIFFKKARYILIYLFLIIIGVSTQYKNINRILYENKLTFTNQLLQISPYTYIVQDEKAPKYCIYLYKEKYLLNKNFEIIKEKFFFNSDLELNHQIEKAFEIAENIDNEYKFIIINAKKLDSKYYLDNILIIQNVLAEFKKYNYQVKELSFTNGTHWQVVIYYNNKNIFIDFPNKLIPNVKLLIIIDKYYNILNKFTYIDLRYNGKIIAA